MIETIVNIKGEKYKVTKVDELIINDDDLCDGICDYHNKEIKVSSKVPYDRLKNVIAHEIMHAFLFESGLHKYANDEQLIDWLAFTYPQFKKTIDELTLWF